MDLFPADWLTYSMRASGLSLRAGTAPSADAALAWAGECRKIPACEVLIEWAASVTRELCADISRSRGVAKRYSIVLLDQQLNLLLVIPDPSGDAFVFVVPATTLTKVCDCVVDQLVNAPGCGGVQ